MNVMPIIFILASLLSDAGSVTGRIIGNTFSDDPALADKVLSAHNNYDPFVGCTREHNALVMQGVTTNLPIYELQSRICGRRTPDDGLLDTDVRNSKLRFPWKEGLHD